MVPVAQSGIDRGRIERVREMRSDTASRDRQGAGHVNTTPLEVVTAGRDSSGNRVWPAAGATAGARGGSRAPSAAARPLFSRARGLGSGSGLFEQQEPVGQDHHRRVVVEPAPAPALEVVQPQLLLHLLVTLFHTP